MASVVLVDIAPPIPASHTHAEADVIGLPADVERITVLEDDNRRLKLVVRALLLALMDQRIVDLPPELEDEANRGPDDEVSPDVEGI